MNLSTLFQDPNPIHDQLLSLLKVHRFATTHQLVRFTLDRYGRESSARRQTLRHLETLEDHKLITRLERRVGGWQGGSSVSVWALTTAGYRMVTHVSRRQRPHAISTTFLDHILATTETSLRFEEIVRTSQYGQIVIKQEPACWRYYTGRLGQLVTLKPDLDVEITGDEFTDRYFVEVDLATENPARVIAKTRAYGDYLRTRKEQEETGVFPAVLWIAPTIKRRDQIRQHLAREPDLPNDLWIAITLDDLEFLINDGPENYLGAINTSQT